MAIDKGFEPHEEASHELPEFGMGSIEAGLSIDHERERKLLRKLDLYLAPLFTIIFLAAYLDRSNIGNAGSAGMLEEIGMSSSELGSMWL